MDGQLADPRDPELRALTERFVRVRLIQMGGVDLATFQFDPFLSWSVFFMNADKTIYGRYGRAHPDTKRAEMDSNPNYTVDGLKAALRRALEIHEGYVSDSDAWAPRLAGKTGPEPRWRFAENTPSARKYKRLRRVEPGEEDGCMHCHEVHRSIVDSYFMKRIPVTDDMLWLYPRPHVLGLTMDNRTCATISAVAPDSAAAAAGLLAGDEMLALGGQPLVSIADIQWVLQQTPDDGGDLPVEIRRGDETTTAALRLQPGWRRAEDWVWRYRLAGYASWLWAGVGFVDDRSGVRVDHRAPNWWKRPNAEGKAKLRPGDVIVEVDGKSGMDRSELLAYLMRDKKLGSKVKLRVLRDGEKESVTFKIPKEQPEVQGY